MLLVSITNNKLNDSSGLDWYNLIVLRRKGKRTVRKGGKEKDKKQHCFSYRVYLVIEALEIHVLIVSFIVSKLVLVSF